MGDVGLQKLPAAFWKLFSSPKPPPSAIIRLCESISVNTVALRDFLNSEHSNYMTRSERDKAWRAILNAETTVQQADPSLNYKIPERMLRKRMNEVISELRNLGVAHSLNMDWSRSDASVETAITVATVIAAGCSTSAATSAGITPAAAASTVPSNSDARLISTQVWVWDNHNHRRPITELSSADYIHTKTYAGDDTIDKVLFDLRQIIRLKICGYVRCYIRRNSEHSYTEPGLRWELKKSHRMTIQSLPLTTINDAAQVILEVVTDNITFVLFVKYIQPPLPASGIVVHLSGNGVNLDNIITSYLPHVRFRYQNLLGENSELPDIYSDSETFQCNWCILRVIVHQPKAHRCPAKYP
ncbi:hypothetical protein FRC02_002805 [Tulasnella sp. 418]|nr:hypothetical protein FRC02_002805 [Tulasnella sp. 418]